MSEAIVGNLRSEIVEAQKARIDLLKWKIILVSAIGAAGLGLQKDFQQAPALLGLIPLVCAYVDVICIHHDMRIFVIAKFLRAGGASGSPTALGYAQRYEALCETHRLLFVLETFALLGATVCFSLLVLWLPEVDLRTLQGSTLPMTDSLRRFLALSAKLGMAVSGVATLFQVLAHVWPSASAARR